MAPLLASLCAHGWVACTGGAMRGPAYLMLTAATYHTRLRLLCVEPDARGKGVAVQALSDLTQAADATATRLVLSASPFGKGGLDAPALMALYARFGFVHIGPGRDGTPEMTRTPRRQPQDSTTRLPKTLPPTP